MKKILDGHIHSKYSRACSRELELPQIGAQADKKGIDIIATGDFTHPQWFSHIKAELAESASGSGLYVLKNYPSVKAKFILSTELSLIYKDLGQTRRIHVMLHAPSLKAAEELNKKLGANFNLKSDGRPMLGLKAPDLVKICLEIDPKFLIYPAHIWTPWYALFGSKSGFDRIEDCFKEYSKYIYAYESGLSSDPAMNWRIKQLDNLLCLSNSDAHGLDNIGREANVLELKEESYDDIYKIISTEHERLLYTIEFYPEEGMYHFDGHRDCSFSSEPKTSKKLKGLCPKCHKPLILGVAYRVEELADRPEGEKPKSARPFKKLVALDKIIKEARGVKSRSAKKVKAEYDFLIKTFGSELKILLELDLKEFEKVADPLLAEGLRRVRQGKLEIKPGFDGQYGEIKIFTAEEIEKQKKLF